MSRHRDPKPDHFETRALIYQDFAWFKSQPYLPQKTPPVDIGVDEADYLAARIRTANHVEVLKQIGDEIIAATGFGSTHVLNTAALARAFALTGLHRAAELAARIDTRSRKLAWPPEAEALPYHGYREALGPCGNEPGEGDEA